MATALHLSSAMAGSMAAGSPRTPWADMSDDEDQEFVGLPSCARTASDTTAEASDDATAEEDLDASTKSSEDGPCRPRLEEKKKKVEDLRGRPFSVRLDGLPQRLCNEAHLEAMLHTAGVTDFSLKVMRGSRLRREDGGVAVVELQSYGAAVLCYNHFAASSWASGALQVTMDGPDSQDPAAWSFGGWEGAEGQMWFEPASDIGWETAACDLGGDAAGYGGGAEAAAWAAWSSWSFGMYQATPEAHQIASASAHAHARRRAAAAAPKVDAAA